MRWATIALAILALGAGLTAAWHWYRSASAPTPSLERLESNIRDPITHLTAMEQWLEESAIRNRKAAGWAAIAVIAGSISSILGALN